MSATPLPQRIAAEHDTVAASLPALIAPASRRAALEQLLARGVPNVREDAWKYASLRSLERARFAPAAAAPPPPLELPAPIEGFERFVFLDGRLLESASATLGTTPGVAVTRPAAAAAGRAPLRPADAARLALLNEAFAVDGLEIDAGAAAGEPRGVEIVFVAASDASAGASYPRARVSVAAGARLQLIERHLSAGPAASLVNAAVSVEIGAGASLTHYRIQDVSARATWLDALQARVAESGEYRLACIGTGAQSARSSLEVLLEGSGAELVLDAVGVADASQVLDTYALVEHRGAQARTTETFRGIAAGRSRVAFNGHIVVAAGTSGVDSQQSLRGLITGAQAEIDLRPQLEIYTDDVRCSHGATSGKLDEAMLFYLLSRGLDRKVAETLLEWAFLEDVVARIAVAPLRRQLERRLAGALKDTLIEEELL